MLALVGTVMSRSPSGNVLLRYGDGFSARTCGVSGILGLVRSECCAAIPGAALRPYR